MNFRFAALLVPLMISTGLFAAHEEMPTGATEKGRENPPQEQGCLAETVQFGDSTAYFYRDSNIKKVYFVPELEMRNLVVDHRIDGSIPPINRYGKVSFDISRSEKSGKVFKKLQEEFGEANVIDISTQGAKLHYPEPNSKTYSDRDIAPLESKTIIENVGRHADIRVQVITHYVLESMALEKNPSTLVPKVTFSVPCLTKNDEKTIFVPLKEGEKPEVFSTQVDNMYSVYPPEVGKKILDLRKKYENAKDLKEQQDIVRQAGEIYFSNATEQDKAVLSLFGLNKEEAISQLVKKWAGYEVYSLDEKRLVPDTPDIFHQDQVWPVFSALHGLGGYLYDQQAEKTRTSLWRDRTEKKISVDEYQNHPSWADLKQKDEKLRELHRAKMIPRTKRTWTSRVRVLGEDKHEEIEVPDVYTELP